MFYDNYVRLCNSINKTPSAVAIEMGISKPTVSRWKSGSKPNHATAVKVADYFGVSVEAMFEQQANPAAKTDTLSEAQERIIKKIKALTPEELSQKMSAIEAVLNIKL